MSKGDRKPSKFAEVLRRLLDHTGIFDRKEWSEFLGVTPSAISQWLHDETMPRPELLRMIISIVKSSDDVSRDVLEDFDSMASKPGDQVLPPSRKLGMSINAYMVSPVLNGFMRDLQRLGPTDQEKVLLRASEECSIIAGVIKQPSLLSSANKVTLGAFHEVRKPINYELPEGRNFSASLQNHESDQSEQSVLPQAALEAAEDVIASLGERANSLFDQVIKYLTGTTDESFRPIARTFCLHALAHVRTQHNNAPLVVMRHILRSMGGITELPNIQRMTDALNALFLVDKETAILVQQDDGKFGFLEKTSSPCDEDIEACVRAIGPHELKYVPTKRLNSAYESVNFNDLLET